jgi:hypothetical protein
VTTQKIEHILRTANCAPVALADKDVWGWQHEWRLAFAGQLHAETGKWIRGEYDWHVFSFGKCVHKHGDRAWSAYKRIEPGPFLVLSSYTHETFGFSCNGEPPDALDQGVDIVVASPSMEWTMAFNHERYGPYFAVTR